MFQYEVLSEQEAMSERFQLLKAGEYDAVITASQDTVSASSGNPMMDMTVSVFDSNGRQHDVRDFLVFTKNMMWKVIHFADSAGLLKQYESGKLCSQEALNARLRVKIAIEEGSEIPKEKLKGKADGSKYPSKNKVEEYIRKRSVNTPDPMPQTHFTDDDVPFL